MNYDIDQITAKPGNGKAGVEAFFASKGDTLYAILPRWPLESLVLREVWPTRSTTVTLLGQDGTLKWKAREADIEIAVPAPSWDQASVGLAYALKITNVGTGASAPTPQQ